MFKCFLKIIIPLCKNVLLQKNWQDIKDLSQFMPIEKKCTLRDREVKSVSCRVSDRQEMETMMELHEFTCVYVSV